METIVWCSGLMTEGAPALAQAVPRIGLHCVLCYLPAAAVPFIPWAVRRARLMSGMLRGRASR